VEQKQKRLPKLTGPTSAAVAAGMCLMLSGCYRIYEGKAEENIKTAEQWDAGKFDQSKGPLEQAKKELASGKQADAAGQGGEARTHVKQAATLGEEAMNQAVARYSDQQLKAAEDHVKIAAKNDLNRTASDRYAEADALLGEARQANTDQKYEKSIGKSNEVIAKVNQMLANVQNDAENNLTKVRTAVKELTAAMGETYTPQELDRARENERQIAEKVEKARDYKSAIQQSSSALGEIQSATVQAKKKHSEDELLKLEDKIAEAIAEEAPVHVPDQLQDVQDRYEQLLANYYDKQYDSVLNASGILRPKVDELITMARIEATKDRINRVEDAIARFRNQNIENYLPGRLTAMEDLLAKARQEFNNNNYEGAKLEANNALVEYERISGSFDALAEKQLKQASTEVGAAKEAYERMKQVFGAATPVDARLESRYQVQASDLGTRLNSTIQTLNIAAQNRAAKEYRKAIEQSEQSAQAANSVANGTYKLVAENALLGIQDQISDLERQGAREFASTSLSDVQGMVQKTKDLLSQNRSREAAESAARTRAALENVKQELARRAANEAATVDKLIQRIEGGAGEAPAAGGMRRMGVTHRQLPYGEYPGGSEANNREGMLDEAVALAESMPAQEMQLAQTHTGHPINSSGYTGSPAVIENRAIPNGTFMHSDKPSNVFLGTGQPNGAAIGTRAEPVVDTYEATGAYRSESTAAYEAPTAPGPFVATTSLDTPDPKVATGLVPAASEITSVQRQLEEIMNDNQRAKDLEDFRPDAMEAARQKLDESSSALASQDYTRAVQLARDAQRTLLAADRDAAKLAAKRDLQASADRVNLANAAGAAMFAPAQLNEARRLYDQGNAFMGSGDYHEARKVAARALVAAEDARSYNVDKARDLASLSVRYGGYEAASPALTEANRLSDIADDMMRDPNTAAQGQEVAKQAVLLSQIALDTARDYTYQERLDNIYKALNQALRAGANYFNVAEIKRLIAELAIARDQYCTRNFDAVELKLKDIEARLARVIETTPLVLEENLVETTEKLNALILAGAENWMAQEVDDVKSLMNRSVIDFRKHDYQSSYTNIKNAMKLTDRIEERLQEQVYFDAVTELFAQMDDAFHKFRPVIDHDAAFMKKLISTEWGQPRALDLSSQLNPNEFKDTINDIYQRAIHLKPPKTEEAIHTDVIIAIKTAKVAAENFQKLYILDQVNMPDAYDIIDTAYNQIRRAKTLRGEVQVRLIEPQARMKVIRAEKIVNY